MCRCVDVSVFSFITPTIFTAILHLQQVLAAFDDPLAVAKSLLKDNVSIVDLPQLFKTCKLFLITKIFNKAIFEYYIDEHPPIAFEIYKQLQKDHGNDEFLTAIISPQIPFCSIMNNYSAQKKVYDSYNTIKARDCPFVGHVIPNGENAMKYAIEAIRYEFKRERMRQELLENDDQNQMDEYDEYGNSYDTQYDDPYDDNDDGYDRYQMWYEDINTKLHQDIDYGLCAAFDDMVESGIKIDAFLTELIGLLLSTCERNNGNRSGDRSHFCFYALAYMVHRLFILCLEKNDRVDFYKDSPGNVSSEIFFDFFGAVLSSYERARKDDRIQKMIQQRINDCMKWKSKCFSKKTGKHFPESVLTQISKSVSDPEWLMQNFAMKCGNRDCIKSLQYVLEECLETKNVSESMNKIFEQYLGVRIKSKQKQDNK